MRLLVETAGVAIAHFALTAGSLLGAVGEAGRTVRQGLHHVGAVGVFLHATAATLAQPGASLLGQFSPHSGWTWPILLVNSLLWGAVLVVAYRALVSGGHQA